MRPPSRSAFALGLTALLALSTPLVSSAETDAVPPGEGSAEAGFIGTSGTNFTLDGDIYPVVGSNNYYPMYVPQVEVDSVFSAAQDANFNTMRVWGFFSIGSPTSNEVASIADKDKGVYFQYWDDDLDQPAFNDGDTGLEYLDRVVARAAAHDLRLVLPLTNNWTAFGGMDQYLLWAEAAGEDVSTHDDFYTNELVKTWYKEWIDHLLNRTNTVTGIAYKDDPTIMAWELANEPRCIGDGGPADGSWGSGTFPRSEDCTAATITPWVAEMSAYIKSIDANHLVGTGDEGFFNWSDTSSAPDGSAWLYDGTDGVDTEAWAAIDTIDYISYHLYPDHWGTDAQWGEQWITEHNAAADQLNKPALLGEFGWQDQQTRNQVYQGWLNTQLETGGAGTLYWILSGEREDGTTYPDYDGFTVYCPSPVCQTIQNFHSLAAGHTDPLPPVADDDVVSVDFGQTAKISVTDNDIVYGTATLQLDAVNLDPSSTEIVREITLAGGTVSVADTGVVTVVPNDEFTGEISFTYTVRDSAGATSNAATVRVHVAPADDAWVVFEDFTAGAERWSCTAGSTVTAADGVGTLTNNTGEWDWCFYTAESPLDLSNSGLLRYDFLGSDSGMNPEIMVQTGDDLLWQKLAVSPPTWTEPAVGTDGPTVRMSDFSADFQSTLTDVRKIGIGLHVGTHQVTNFRYDTSGGSEPEPPVEVVEIPLSGFETGTTWSCDSGDATVSIADGVATFANDSGDWTWCAWTPEAPLDLAEASTLLVDFVATDSGVGPEVAFKTGEAWTWGGQQPAQGTSWFNPGDPVQPVTFNLAGIAEDYRETLSLTQQVLLGLHPGEHQFANLRVATQASDGGDGEEPGDGDGDGDGIGGETPEVPSAPAHRMAQVVPTPSLNGDHFGDVLAVDQDGKLWFYSGKPSGSLGKAILVGGGWSGLTVSAPGDFNSDGNADLLAKDAQGQLWFYPGRGDGTFGSRSLAGWNWGDLQIIPAGDVTGDGIADVLAIDSAGTLFHYAGNGKGGFTGKLTHSGHGWASVSLYPAGDIDGDGLADILSIRADGTLHTHLAKGAGQFSKAEQSGQGWANYDLFAGADLNGDGRADLLSRDQNNQLWFYAGRAGGGFRTAVQIGSGW